MVAARPGARLASAACSTEVVVVKSRAADVDLRCGGMEMVPVGDAAAAAGSPAPGVDGGTLVGKRYVTSDESVEVLCTKAGQGTLATGGVPLEVKGAKPLPSSD